MSEGPIKMSTSSCFDSTHHMLKSPRLTKTHNPRTTDDIQSDRIWRSIDQFLRRLSWRIGRQHDSGAEPVSPQHVVAQCASWWHNRRRLWVHALACNVRYVLSSKLIEQEQTAILLVGNSFLNSRRPEDIATCYHTLVRSQYLLFFLRGIFTVSFSFLSRKPGGAIRVAGNSQKIWRSILMSQDLNLST